MTPEERESLKQELKSELKVEILQELQTTLMESIMAQMSGGLDIGSIMEQGNPPETETPEVQQ